MLELCKTQLQLPPCWWDWETLEGVPYSFGVGENTL